METEEKINNSPEIKIPEDLKVVLNESVKRISKEIESSQPNLVILPLRSAPVLWPAIEKKLSDSNINIPQTIDIEIGQEIPMEFTKYFSKIIDIPEEDIDVYEYLKDFKEWLRTDERTAKIVESLQKSVPKDININNFMIIDDTTYTGLTLDVTAPEIAKLAFGSNIDIKSDNVFGYKDWINEILEATFGELESSDEYFFQQLARNSMLERGLGDIIEIKTEEDLKLLGEQCKEERHSNPFIKLKDKFGISYLLNFSAQLSSKLKEAVN